MYVVEKHKEKVGIPHGRGFPRRPLISSNPVNKGLAGVEGRGFHLRSRRKLLAVFDQKLATRVLLPIK